MEQLVTQQMINWMNREFMKRMKKGQVLPGINEDEGDTPGVSDNFLPDILNLVVGILVSCPFRIRNVTSNISSNSSISKTTLFFKSSSFGKACIKTQMTYKNNVDAVIVFVAKVLFA
jgi:hypothetical protein